MRRNLSHLLTTACLLAVIDPGASADDLDNPKARKPMTAKSAQNAPAADLQIKTLPAQPADSTADDLQRVVVLCATQPDSAQFRREWAAYIETHHKPGLDVDALIEDVLSAAAQHQNETQGGRQLKSAAHGGRIRKQMRDTANEVLGLK